MSIHKDKRDENPNTLSEFEFHDRVSLKFELNDHETILIYPYTEAGFFDEPTASLQLRMGRTVPLEVKTIETAKADQQYVVEVEMKEPYLDALLIVEGSTVEGKTASSIEGFVFVRFDEQRSYEVFGPSGAIRLILNLDKNLLPYSICVSSAPTYIGIAQISKEITLVSETHTIINTPHKEFPRDGVNIAISFAANPFGYQLENIENEQFAIYRYHEKVGIWEPIKGSSIPDISRKVVVATIYQPGIYAVFAECTMTPIDLVSENEFLRKTVRQLTQDLHGKLQPTISQEDRNAW